MQLFTESSFATSISTLSAAVIDSAKGRGKIAAAFRDIAAPAYGEPAKQKEVAELLGAVRREIQAKRESYCKWLSSNGQAANVDFALVALSEHLGLPEDAPLALFAVGRCAGWIAHAIEQGQTGGLIRPRARYAGIRPWASA